MVPVRHVNEEGYSGRMGGNLKSAIGTRGQVIHLQVHRRHSFARLRVILPSLQTTEPTFHHMRINGLQDLDARRVAIDFAVDVYAARPYLPRPDISRAPLWYVKYAIAH